MFGEVEGGNNVGDDVWRIGDNDGRYFVSKGVVHTHGLMGDVIGGCN